MPIYEFYCGPCHRVFNFLARRADTRKRPDCPRCGRAKLERRASSFAISKGRKEHEGEGPSDLDERKLEQAMESLGREAEGLDEDDPRQAARLMRKLWDAAGLDLGPGMQDALRRMEAGEDPESLEEELGEALEQDPFGAQPGSTLKRLRRKVGPPTVDPKLYEM